MQVKSIPLNSAELEAITREHPTPFHLYDEAAIRANARKFNDAFSWAPAFKEYFAVKATPNPYILKILKEEGFGTDCSSYPELLLSEKVSITGENIMFSSNETPAYEYEKAAELGAIINLDDFSHIEYLEKHVGLPEVLSLRYNPGSIRDGNVIIGKPEESKYGLTRKQLFEGYKLLREKGVKRFGLHMFIVSNELSVDVLTENATMLFQLAVDLKNDIGIRLEFINMSGGIGIPYKPEDTPVDLYDLGARVKAEYEHIVKPNGLDPLKIFMESGRMITGPYGYLVTRVIHKKDIYKQYLGTDACMANLMRPALYGAYHHITVVGKEDQPASHTYDVVGSLCENNDKFAIDRKLPKVEIGDLIVIHDSGAHGHCMGFNYNGKLRSAELLLKEDKSIQLIRRAETIDDYFSTLDFSNL